MGTSNRGREVMRDDAMLGSTVVCGWDERHFLLGVNEAHDLAVADHAWVDTGRFGIGLSPGLRV